MEIIGLLLQLAILVFFGVMTFRICKATEKIADKLEDLVNQKKES
jgi:hypothetical protein